MPSEKILWKTLTFNKKSIKDYYYYYHFVEELDKFLGTNFANYLRFCALLAPNGPVSTFDFFHSLSKLIKLLISDRFSKTHLNCWDERLQVS